jgi:hypothetical protein
VRKSLLALFRSSAKSNLMEQQISCIIGVTNVAAYAGEVGLPMELGNR